ncbi:AMP-binding protein [Nocardioides sp. 1609]|uniref:AMP-binding protein n=1 Tax=Nocardioides sp. 1609 TaxID=2508327 RepID=UPI00107053FA|nr:AMP-binding protein [Nocardioides sp. 1609]
MHESPPGVTLGEFLPLSAARHPDRTCFALADGRRFTFAETNARVNRLVDALRSEGFGRGDRVAVLALDSHRYMEVVLACMKLGAVYVPLNYRLQRDEVDTLLARAAPVALFHDARYDDLLAGVAAAHPTLRLVVRLDDEGDATGYEPLLAAGRDVEPDVVCDDRDQIALAFTSGTTGLPKGVMQSQRMLKNITYAGLAEYQARPDDVRYTAAPTFHISGVCGLFLGIATGYSSYLLPQFEPSTVLDLLSGGEVSAAFLVPTMISSVLQQPGAAERSYDRLRLMIYGASPISPTLLRRAMEVFGCEFLQAFGAGTEAGLQSVLTPEDHRLALAGRPELLRSCGRPSFGVAMRVVDADLREVGVGEVGEVATRSDQVMDGYLEMPEETARAFAGGWFRAGDMGYRDEQGYLYLHGRAKDMIIRGGENIYPIEIETVLAEHPSIAQVAVVGVEDEHWGEVVRAFVVPAAGQVVDAGVLRAHCATRLARYKVPRDVVVLDAMPLNASGKILKRELRVRADDPNMTLTSVSGSADTRAHDPRV